MFLIIALLYIFMENVYSLATFKVAWLVQSTVWPEITVTNDTTENGLVRIQLNGFEVSSTNCMHFTSKVCDLHDSGDIDGLIAFVDCSTAQVLSQQRASHLVPVITVTRDSCHLESDNIFLLRPSCFTTNSLLSDAVQYKNWHNILLFHDETFGSKCVFDLLMKMSRLSVSTRLVKTSNFADPGEYLKFITKYEPGGIIVAGGPNTATDILIKAQTDGLLHHYWIFVDCFTPLILPNGTNTDTSHLLFLKQQFDNWTTNLDTCVTNDSPSPETEFEEYMSYLKTWFLNVFTSVVDGHNITTLEPISCHHNGQLPKRLVVMETAKKKFQQNNDVYQLCSTSAPYNESLEYIGKWTSNGGLSLQRPKLFGNDFVDFGNRTLRVAVLPLPPYVIFSQTATNTTTYSGFCIDILDQLASKFMFRYEIVSPDDNAYGSVDENGTWNGMVAMVMQREADFAAGPFTITSIRDQVIDFTTTYMEEGAGILTKRPTEEKNKEYKVLKPLSGYVWIAVGVTIVVVGILLYILNKLSPFSKNPSPNKKVIDKEMILTSMWVVYGSFVEQGGDPRPRSASGRILLSVWWAFTILMVSTYTANLAAYLTVTILDSPVNSLEELAASDEIKPLIFSGSNLHTLFKTSTSSVYRQIWSGMSGMPEVNELDIALNYVKEAKYAFLSDYSLLEYIMLQDCHTYAIADDKFNNAGLGFVLQENSPYLDAFNIAIMKMLEAGFIEQWRNKWWPRSDSCTSSDRSGSAQSLGLDSISGLFYIYMGIVCLSFLVFLLELFINSQNARRCFGKWIRKRNNVDKPNTTSNNVCM